VKVFLSWSGETSHKVALAFKEWLRRVVQFVDPFVSSEDIQKGARSLPEIEKALADARFGIICLTKENLAKPWLHFEAGALSRAIANPLANVCPFLFDFERSLLEGPLAQFQNVLNDKDDVRRLVESINAAANKEAQIEVDVLRDGFTMFWPRLQDELRDIAAGQSESPATPRRSTQELLEEILELIRAQQRLGASKEDVVEISNALASAFDRARRPAALEGLNNLASLMRVGSNLESPKFTAAFKETFKEALGPRTTQGLRAPARSSKKP